MKGTRTLERRPRNPTSVASIKDSDKQSGVAILKITTAHTLNLHLNASEPRSQGMLKSKPQSPRPPGFAHAGRMLCIWSSTLRECECPQRSLAVSTETMQTCNSPTQPYIKTPCVLMNGGFGLLSTVKVQNSWFHLSRSTGFYLRKLLI